MVDLMPEEERAPHTTTYTHSVHHSYTFTTVTGYPTEVQSFVDAYFKDYPANAYSTKVMEDSNKGDVRFVKLGRLSSCD